MLRSGVWRAAPNRRLDMADDFDFGGGGDPSSKEAAYDISVDVYAVLGRATVQVKQLLKLGRGAVVELDRRVNEPIDLYVNKLLVGRGEVVVVDDRIGVTITDMVRGG
ncbi:MAG: flagellar motor switch protein FliN [Alphaproteobacteria bacterium]|nr:flagellar motor switch protein FliN [Alphaproteobacteria bacterium]MBF0374071.1 flagellar motor switch protein FliN [Alphaproteobacteria bacterium]